MHAARIMSLGLLLAGSIALAAQPSIELNGVMVDVGVTRLSLVDRANDTRRWIEIGQTFSGYKVSAYDPTTETATLTKDGASVRVRLNSSKIKTDTSGPATMAPAEITRAVLNNLRQISGAADQYFLETGKTTVTLSDLVGPTKYIKQLVSVDGESYAGLQLKPGAPLAVSTAHGVNVSYAP